MWTGVALTWQAIDWWSVGILLYEMLCGITPFRSGNKAELKRMITMQKLKFTKSADGESISSPFLPLPPPFWKASALLCKGTPRVRMISVVML